MADIARLLGIVIGLNVDQPILCSVSTLPASSQ